jgi:hypothetical protein
MQTLLVLTVAAIGMSILLSLAADTGHDQLWLLLAAQRMGPNLNPYNATVFESNPPLAIWLSGIIVAAAHALHLSLTVTLKLAVTLLAAASAAVCAKLVRILHPELKPNHPWLLGIAYILIFGAIPARDFGQRDHILALLVLPYLIAAALDTHRRAPRLSRINRMSLAMLAAVGIALKPHQAIIPVIVELSLIVRSTNLIRRRPQNPGTPPALYAPPFRSMEPAVFLLSAAIYLGTIRILAPTYLTQIVPVLRQTYWAFGRLSLFELTAAAPGLHILLALDLVLTIALTRKIHESAAIPILNLAGFCGVIGFYLQGTGWYYQQLPAISFFSLAIVFQLIDFSKLRPLSIPNWFPIPLTALTTLAFALTIHFSNFHVTPRGIEQAQSTPDPTFFADLPPGTTVATLTTSVDDTVPPAFRYHLTLAQRYPHLWMLPAILRNESGPAHLTQLDRLQHQFMVEDLNRWHPALILIERCQDPAVHCQVLEDRHDDLLAWFLRDPAFALIFSKYRFLRSSGSYDAYTLTNP